MGTGWLGRASRRVHRVMHRGGDRKETDGLRGEDAKMGGITDVGAGPVCDVSLLCEMGTRDVGSGADVCFCRAVKEVMLDSEVLGW